MRKSCRSGYAVAFPDASGAPPGRRLSRNRYRDNVTYGCSVPEGEAFWYENSSGLVEIAVNRVRADWTLGLVLGMPFHFADKPEIAKK